MAKSVNPHDARLERGRGYREEQLPTAYHQVQEQFLLRVIQAGGLPMNRVLELGCGGGRITKRLAERFPHAKITGFELSQAACEGARQHCAGLRNVTIQTHNFYSPQPFPGGGNWDTTIAVEIFLHHSAPLLRVLLRRIASQTRFIVNIDWSESWTWPMPEHVWAHDYTALYHEAGLRCAAFTLPQKVAGLQQRLFVAGCELPQRLVELEQASATGTTPAKQEAISPPPVVDWQMRQELAITELRGTIPPGSKVILVNNDEWGCEAQALPALRVLPFLERNGRFWGPPATSTEALSELERMRASGAQYLAVTWNAFWWLEHYRAFSEHLDQRARRLCATDTVVIFQL